jgi:S1-C subfamily serine protease
MNEQTSPRPEAATGAATTLGQFSLELSALVDQVSRSTVTVGGRSHRPGTGTVIAPDLIVTADHSLDRDEDITIRTTDGRRLTATVAGRDPSTDLALLRVPDLNLAPLPVATAPARAGMLALAIARSWHAQAVPSFGIIHGVGGPMRVASGVRLDGVIHPGLSLARGISGAPLVNVDGQLLGIITSGLLRGWPIAIPHETVTQVVASLGDHGRIRRGHLGVGLQPVRLAPLQRVGLDLTAGALIVSLTPDGPAERAGLLVGDIIIRAAGTTIEDVDDVQTVLGGVTVGQPLEFDILRGTAQQRITVTVGERLA